MVPPPALRKRLQAQADAEKKTNGKTDGMSDKKRPTLVIGTFVVVVGLCWLLRPGQSTVDLPKDDFVPEYLSPEAQQLMEDAADTIRRKYDYPRAKQILDKAFEKDPESMAVRSYLGIVLLSLDKLEEAAAHFRIVFKSRTRTAEDMHFLQQYILVLHRLGKQDELAKVWPIISAKPDVSWRTPLQCPDAVDPTLLTGAVPFPDPTVPRVTRLMLEHKTKIQAEFDVFCSRKGWDSTRYFQANQDNDLVLGNDNKRWTEMLLFDKGVWDPRTCHEMPTACKILRGLTEVEGILHGKRSGQVSLLKLEAGTTLVPHFGSVNWRYTAHLGLMVPENVVMKGGNESQQFVKGEVLLLDDSFLHSVEHRGEGPRVTFFVNFFHPSTHPISYDEYLARKNA